MRKVVIALPSLRGVGLGECYLLGIKSCKRRACLWGTEKAMAALAEGTGKEREHRASFRKELPSHRGGTSWGPHDGGSR